jgi:hypothetical protein
VLTCHWTVGVGLPLAAAVKLALAAPYVTLWLLGWVATETAVQGGVGFSASKIAAHALFPPEGFLVGSSARRRTGSRFYAPAGTSVSVNIRNVAI